MVKVRPKILKRLRKHPGRFEPISYYREKILKHQGGESFKVFRNRHFQVAYKKPWELLHTYRELFEQELYRFSVDHADPVILDGGANIGLSVIYFKQLFPQARITAFEPDRDNLFLLQENIARNNLSQVEVVPAALWKSQGTMWFEQSGSQGSRLSSGSRQGRKIEVNTVRLRDMLETRQVDLLKLDIEGAEFDVLEDCRDLLHRLRYLFVEYHGRIEESGKLTQLLQWIGDAGFQYYIKTAWDALESPFYRQRTQEAFDQQLNIFCYRATPVHP